jgi:dihydroorotase
MQFDLLIKGGEVVDDAAGLSGKRDVAVKKDRIAAVEPDIPASAAFQVIDANGLHVTPGLIDIHAHIYRGATYWGIDADAVGSRTGVTS